MEALLYTSKYPKTSAMVNELITPKDACLYCNSMYCHNTLILTVCALLPDIWITIFGLTIHYIY